MGIMINGKKVKIQLTATVKRDTSLKTAGTELCPPRAKITYCITAGEK